jgi:hypothetical protein
MLTTAMVAGGIAAITGAAAQQWSDGRERQLLDMTVQQHRHAMGPIIRSARGLGGVVTQYKPAVFFWQADTWGGAADGNPQFAEMALIEYDASTQSLLYYQADPSKLNASSTYASTVLTTSQMADANMAQYFKEMSWIKPARSLLGPGRALDADIVALRVSAATFAISNSANLQSLTVNLTVDRGSYTKTLNNVYGVRAPAVTTN